MFAVNYTAGCNINNFDQNYHCYLIVQIAHSQLTHSRQKLHKFA